MNKKIRTSIALSIVLLAFHVTAAPNKRNPTTPNTPPGKMEIRVNRTIAKYGGTAFRLCRGRTSTCPERCGQSGGFASFSVVDYLQYDKRGKYGDEKNIVHCTNHRL